MDYGIFYENGLYDAWKAAKRLREFSSEEREKIFGGSINDVLTGTQRVKLLKKLKSMMNLKK